MKKKTIAKAILFAISLSCPVSALNIDPKALWAVDGDTVKFQGDRYRLTGFDTPEVFSPKCEYEKALGDQATALLRAELASGRTVDLIILPGLDKYGRGLARLYIGGREFKDIVIGAGLARPYDGGKRQGWCS